MCLFWFVLKYMLWTTDVSALLNFRTESSGDSMKWHHQTNLNIIWIRTCSPIFIHLSLSQISILLFLCKYMILRITIMKDTDSWLERSPVAICIQYNLKRQSKTPAQNWPLKGTKPLAVQNLYTKVNVVVTPEIWTRYTSHFNWHLED